jgi:LysM repeat protein
MAVLLAGCQTPPPPAPSAPPPAAPAPAPVVVQSSAPAPAAPAPAPEPPAPPGTAQRLALSALEMLELGQEEQATVELQRALQIEPNHRLAQSLLRQITVDPVTALGRESFPYRVQPGETLSRISQRFLGDVYQFYLLARYNDLKVPRQLAGGQLLRIPGRAPPPDPAPSAGAAPASPLLASPALAAPAPVAAPSVVPAAVSPAAAPDPSRAERERRDRITRATREARAAFARQDLATAIREWDRVLDLDPDNATARLERQRAVDLQERLRRVR